MQAILYDTYILSWKEWVKYCLLGAGFLAVFVYVFYRSVLVYFFSLCFVWIFPIWKREDLKKKRKRKLTLEFSDSIMAMSSAMEAGYAVENALKEAAREMELLYGEESLMARELREILGKISMNQPVETLFLDLGIRSQVDEIKDFAQIFAAVRKNGGELVRIVNRTVHVIGESIQVENEIALMTAAKRYEQMIMNAMPLFLVLYLDFTSPDFFEVLYTTMFGRAVMTGCLLIYIVSVLIAKHILDIKI